MADRPTLTDEELEIISEKLLAKLLGRLAQRAKAENDEAAAPPAKRPAPSPEAIADVLARRRRRGR